MKLIALDMDGTVLTTDKRVTEGVLKAITDAKNAGHVVMICSGRAHDDLLPYLKEKKFPNLPISGSNGSATCIDGKMIHQVCMDKDIATQVFNWLDVNQYPFKIYTSKGVFGKSNYLEILKNEILVASPKFGDHQMTVENAVALEQNYPAIPIELFDKLISDEELEIFKFFVLTLRSEKKQSFKQFLTSISGLMVTSSYPSNIEVMAKDGHKGTGMMQVANYYNIPAEDTVAIGDNFNDVPMLKVAGFSIAMGNAEAEVKELCDVVTLTNDEDGVAHAIRTYILKTRQ